MEIKSKLNDSFYIGNVLIPNRLVLAPMAGISNTSYRKIVKEMSEDERPIAQQIFGSDIDTFVSAAKLVEEKMHPDIIDINMGCPVPKVALRAQSGSALLKNPKKIGEIVKAVSEVVKVPVTVKIRSGWDENSINALEVAKICEKNGAKAITIHARTRAQGYSGKANWDIIKEVKENVAIPVIGNGDVDSPIKALEMLQYTKCDAVMIGRAALGNPWIFKECKEYLENGQLISKPSDIEKLNMIRKHYKLLKDDKNEKIALLEIRTHALYYLKDMKDSKYYKELICKTKNEKEFLEVLDNYQEHLKKLLEN